MSLFNRELIKSIENSIHKRNDQLHFIMELLNMGKETAYRRLRGDIPFTFFEACIIAQKIGISLDNIAKIECSSKPVFEMEIFPPDIEEYYSYRLDQHEDSYKCFSSISNFSTHSACNMVPYSFLIDYKNLFKMNTFRFSYLIDYSLSSIKFCDYVLSDELEKRRKELAKMNAFVPEFTFIFDRNMFSSYMNEIKYFNELGLVSDEELDTMKKEFFDFLADIEYLSTQGKNKGGAKAWFYLSNIDFNSNYTYVKGDNFERAYIDGIYLVDTISTSDPRICGLHKQWIESLKKYSTLISVSGEMERRLFFDSQRKLLSDL